jgi:hypothetical protein
MYLSLFEIIFLTVGATFLFEILAGVLPAFEQGTAERDLLENNKLYTTFMLVGLSIIWASELAKTGEGNAVIISLIALGGLSIQGVKVMSVSLIVRFNERIS